MSKTTPVRLTSIGGESSAVLTARKHGLGKEDILVPVEEAVRRYEAFKRDFEEKAKKADEQEREAHALSGHIHEQRIRLVAGLPEPHVCPNCWVKHGRIHLIVAGRAGDPSKFQRWQCNGDVATN